MSPLLGEQIRIALHLESDLPLVSTDQSRIEQVITNLVFNARDAMSNEGELTVGTTVVEVGDGDSHPGV